MEAFSSLSHARRERKYDFAFILNHHREVSTGSLELVLDNLPNWIFVCVTVRIWGQAKAMVFRRGRLLTGGHIRQTLQDLSDTDAIYLLHDVLQEFVWNSASGSYPTPLYRNFNDDRHLNELDQPPAGQL